MQARDLDVTAPRRWSEQLDGIYWLPRIIDKARAALAGTLGTYLYGQSPIDRGLLRALRLSHRDFAVIVDRASDDSDVLAALGRRDPAALERVRLWSWDLARKHRFFLTLLDFDDGYRATWLRGPINVGANVVSRMAKRLSPSHAAQRAIELRGK